MEVPSISAENAQAKNTQKSESLKELCDKHDSDVYALDKADMLRVTRLIMEAFEVALLICNEHLSKFGPARLMDIISQILPTAYVVNTSYWPLYFDEVGRCLCFCKMFKLNCPHANTSKSSWINLNCHVDEIVTFKCSPTEPIMLREFRINLKRFYENLSVLQDGKLGFTTFKFYTVNIFFKLRSGPLAEVELPASRHPLFQFSFRLRFVLAKCDYRNMVISFKPHPLLHNAYGYYIPKLLDYTKYNNNVMDQEYIACTSDAPDFTILMYSQKILMEIQKV